MDLPFEIDFEELKKRKEQLESEKEEPEVCDLDDEDCLTCGS